MRSLPFLLKSLFLFVNIQQHTQKCRWPKKAEAHMEAVSPTKLNVSQDEREHKGNGSADAGNLPIKVIPDQIFSK
jgi:hypothetical protein